MHTAVFDTNILIHFSRGHEGAQAIIRKVEYRFISIVTWVEFPTGIPYPQQDKAKAFLSDMFEIVESPRAVYEDALDIRRAHRMKLPDALIYATARHEDYPLITNNKKDFNFGADDIHIPYE